MWGIVLRTNKLYFLFQDFYLFEMRYLPLLKIGFQHILGDHSVRIEK